MDKGQMRSGAGISKELERLGVTTADAVFDVTRTLDKPKARHEDSTNKFQVGSVHSTADSLAPR